MVHNIVSVFRSECLEQPQRLEELFQAYSSDREIRDELARFEKSLLPRAPLVWAGMGASYCSSISGATRLSSSGRVSFVVEASEWLHFTPATLEGVAGPVLVTTSGESAELVELCHADRHRPLILICNNRESSCWKAAQIRFPILAGEEHANATKTYTNSTALCTILASELTGQAWQGEAGAVAQTFPRTLENVFNRRAELEEFCRGMATLEIIGRGPSLAGAIMGALCVREMTTWRAAAHSGGAFRHGPFLDVDSTHLGIILALGRTAEMGRRLAKDCMAKGSKVILVVDREPVERSNHLLTLKIDPVPEGWESLTSVLVPQALALALIERLGSRYVRIQTTRQ
jgi:glucosamine--fructose-6-phosphate aminotransferase (isomerizing)